MKNFFKMVIIGAVFLMLTGCVKFEFSMGINKDGSVNLQLIEAFDKSLIESDDSNLNTTDLKQIREAGFSVDDYIDDSMKGYKFTKKIGNINSVSFEYGDNVTDINSLLEKADVKLFSVKKGFFKNTYKARLKSSSDDHNQLNSSMSDSIGDLDSSDSITDSSDYSSMMSNIDVNFVVNLPYKALYSNATSIDNSGKKLTWNLMTFQDEIIDFEFELYNMTNVYIVIGVVVLLVLLIIIVIIKKIGNGNSGNKNMQNTILSNQSSNYINVNNLSDININSNSFVTQSLNDNGIGSINLSQPNTVNGRKSLNILNESSNNQNNIGINDVKYIYNISSSNLLMPSELNIDSQVIIPINNLDTSNNNDVTQSSVSSILSPNVITEFGVSQIAMPINEIENNSISKDEFSEPIKPMNDNVSLDVVSNEIEKTVNQSGDNSLVNNEVFNIEIPNYEVNESLDETISNLEINDTTSSLVSEIVVDESNVNSTINIESSEILYSNNLIGSSGSTLRLQPEQSVNQSNKNNDDDLLL